MIKKSILYFFKFLVSLTRSVFSYSSHITFTRFKTKLYTMWVSTEFKHLGHSSSISYPIDLRGGQYISIGNEVTIGKRSVITAWDTYGNNRFKPDISIGNCCSIGDDCHFTSVNSIIIGENVLMGKKITITDNGHGDTIFQQLTIPPIKRPLFTKGSVIIDDNVWIGDKVTILPNVRIGKNSIIGANALVSKDVPPNCIVGGNPATIIKVIKLE